MPCPLSFLCLPKRKAYQNFVTFAFLPAFFFVKNFLYFLAYFLFAFAFPTFTLTEVTLEPLREPFTLFFFSFLLVTTSVFIPVPANAPFLIFLTFFPRISVSGFPPDACIACCTAAALTVAELMLTSLTAAGAAGAGAGAGAGSG